MVLVEFRNSSFDGNPHSDFFIKLNGIIVRGDVKADLLASGVPCLCLGDIDQSPPDPHAPCFRRNGQIEYEVGPFQPVWKELRHKVERVVKVLAERRAFVPPLSCSSMDEVLVKLINCMGDEDPDNILTLHGERGLLVANNTFCLRPIVGKDTSPTLLSSKQELHQWRIDGPDKIGDWIRLMTGLRWKN